MVVVQPEPEYVAISSEVLRTLSELLDLVGQSQAARRAVHLTPRLIETDPAGIPRVRQRLHNLDD